MYDYIRNLSDDERKALFDTAIDEAQANDIPFEEVIGKVIKTFIESKMNKAKEVVEPVQEAPALDEWEDEPDPVAEDAKAEEEEWDEPSLDSNEVIHTTLVEPMADDWEEEQVFDPTTVYDEQEMSDALLGIYSEASEASKEAGQMLSATDFGEWNVLRDAKAGRIFDEDEYFASKQKGSFGYGMTFKEGFVDLCKKVSAKMREAYYTHVMHSSDDVLDAERLGAIDAYQDLFDQSTYFEQGASYDDWKQDDASTISFDTLEGMFSKNGVSRVGLDRRTAKKDGSGINDFDPMYFENEYEAATCYLFPSNGERLSHRLFSEAKEAIQSKIEALKGMTAEQFRGYKLDQMHLSDVERKKFESEVGITHSQDFEDEAFSRSM
jgi:hypothetical protein